MKIIKKCVIGLSTIGLVASLSACGKDEKKDNVNKAEGQVRLIDVIKTNHYSRVIVTNEEHNGNAPVWAGYIGKGKIKGVVLYTQDFGKYGYKELKDLPDKDYKESIVAMGKDAGKKLLTFKGNVLLNTKNGEVVSESLIADDSDTKGFGKNLKNYIAGPNYEKVEKRDKDELWATIKTNPKSDDQRTPYYKNSKLHILTAKGKKYNLKLDNLEETKKDYKDIETNEIEDTD